MLTSTRKNSVGFAVFFWLFASQAAEAGRGNDFGNGGDQIREVFNAARVFAQDLLNNEDGTGQFVNEVPQQELAAYRRYRLELLRHLRQAEHQWDHRPALTQCLSVSISDHEIVKLSYEHCPAIAPTALEAMPLLLKSSWRAVADVADYAKGAPVMDSLFADWMRRFPTEAAKAQMFSMTRRAISGKWFCSLGSTQFNADVRYEGLFQAAWPVVVANARYRVEFMTFLQLNEDRTVFQAVGSLQLPRRQQSENSNVIYDAQCTYGYKANIYQNDAALELRLDISSDGHPDQAEGCPTFSASKQKATCQLRAP